MKANSLRRFVVVGLKQAGLVLVILLFLDVIVLLATAKGLVSATPSIWATGLVSGPIPPILVRFDITDQQLNILWVTLIPPYWACLGAGVGLISWKASDSNPEHKDRVPSRQMLITVAAIGFTVGAISTKTWPSFISSGGSIQNAVVNNLRQLDGAKQQIALEKKLPENYVPTEAELSAYLKHFKPIGSERYVIGSIQEAPYAVFDTDWRIRRRGWREGNTIPKGTEYRLQSNQ